MIQIRQAQYEAFEQQCLADFERRVVQHLREDSPDLVADHTDAELLSKVRLAIVRAERHGLTTELEIVCYVHAMLRYRDDRFDANTGNTAAREVLADPALDPEKKALRLVKVSIEATASKPSGAR